MTSRGNAAPLWGWAAVSMVDAKFRTPVYANHFINTEIDAKCAQFR